MKYIKIRKAKVHNLKSVDVDIPRDSFTVVTGPSGSGKSSLAFDTVFAEGQRRYIESLSSYARQFLGQIDPPDVESIEGLSPAVAIDQKSTSKNPRSTVGTVTEIYDYLRVFFARVGTAHCPESGEKLEAQSAEQIVSTLMKFPVQSKLQILSPFVQNKKGEYKAQLAQFMGLGFSRVRVDGKIERLDDDLKLNKNKKHTLEIVIDRIVVKKNIRSRLTDSVEMALKLGQGSLLVIKNDEEPIYFSENLYSQKSGKSYPSLEPRMFSFNSPLGACQKCNGLGVTKEFHPKSYIFDDALSLSEGAITVLTKKSSFLHHMVKCIAKTEKISMDTPYKKLPAKFRKTLIEGSDKVYTYSFVSENSTFNFKKPFVGISKWLEKKYLESSSDRVKVDLEQYMIIEECSSCEGQKLQSYPLSAKVAGKSINELCFIPIDECYDFFKKIKLTGVKAQIGKKLLKEILGRLKFLIDVGLVYLTLNRQAMTLSGGESQRIRLATQIGSALSGVLYVLDEPSIGLHQRDNQKLIKTLIGLKELGNTLLVVEHDEETMLAADYLIDMGPGAGLHGGEVVAKGTMAQVLKNKKSITGKYLSGKKVLEIPSVRRKAEDYIKLKGATKNNLNKVNVDIPLGGLVAITGVSGSGKSTLIHQVLVPTLKAQLRKGKGDTSLYSSLAGVNHIDSLIELDQSPIGRTPKSNPATYTGLFDNIRTLFSSTNESKIRGYKPGRFSFNVKGGRCEACEGNGLLKIEMNFLPDVYVTCDECFGRRYNQETLNIHYRGKNIHEVLEMSVAEAKDFFKNHVKVHRTLETLYSVGLGYMKLGQPATTLSGGEAQRLKLSRELAKRSKGHCFYVLDEPTTGLHFEDIGHLIKTMNQLIEKGHTVVVIEHNLDVIKTADFIIDLGPDGGKNGGQVIATGTPEQIAKNKKSVTGKYLKKVLKG